jgi:hypothetical protein
MRPNLSVKLGLLTVVVATSALFVSPGIRNGGSDPAMIAAEAWQQAEVARIQEHLAGAERLLLSAGVASFTPAQRSARARNVELLRGYREHGVFPRNIDFAGGREPYFVDDRGVLCAMAYLIAASGRHDIVERVRSTRNNARIRELADDPALVAWLDEAGLSLAEAGRIQPSYGYPPPYVLTERAPVSPEYAVASAGASLANGMAIAWNFPRARRTPPSAVAGTVAVLTGAAGIALGAPNVGEGGVRATLGTWNVAVGSLAVLSGAHTLLGGQRARRSASLKSSGDDSKGSDRAKADAAVRVAPTIGSRTGLSVNVTF